MPLDTLAVPKDRQKLRLLLVGEHPAVLDGLALVLRAESDLQVMGKLRLGEARPDGIRKASPDVLILDFDNPSSLWMLLIRELRRSPAQTKLLIYTACHDQEILLELIGLDIEGLVHKTNDTSNFLKSIRAVASGEYWVYRQLLAEAVRRKTKHKQNGKLTAREVEIVRLVITGASNKEIGDRLSLSVLTVKRHLSNIFNKLNITSRMQLAIRYTQQFAHSAYNQSSK